MARGASQRTIDRFLDLLWGACAHVTHPRCLCTIHGPFVTLDLLNVPENDPGQVHIRPTTARAPRGGVAVE